MRRERGKPSECGDILVRVRDKTKRLRIDNVRGVSLLQATQNGGFDGSVTRLHHRTAEADPRVEKVGASESPLYFPPFVGAYSRPECRVREQLVCSPTCYDKRRDIL